MAEWKSQISLGSVHTQDLKHIFLWRVRGSRTSSLMTGFKLNVSGKFAK